VAHDRAQQGFAALLEQSVVSDGARRNHPNHLPLDGALGLRGVSDLLADRDRLAFANEASEIVVDAVVRNPGHRDRFAGGLAARGQRDVDELRGAARVVVEELVEVAHAVEQE
jgi:hypothetical protein